MTVDQIIARQQLADLAAHHGWTARLPHPGADWLWLELYHPHHRCRITVRWFADRCNATLKDHVTASTWQMVDCTPNDLRWAVTKPDTIGQTIDCVNNIPDLIDLREDRP